MSGSVKMAAAIAWLKRSRDSKSPSVAKTHATVLLAEFNRLEEREETLLLKLDALVDGYEVARYHPVCLPDESEYPRGRP